MVHSGSTEGPPQVLEQVIEVLTPFKQATEALEGDQYPTLSLVNFFFTGISQTLLKMAPSVERVVRSLIVKLEQEMARREQPHTKKLRNMVAMLDPRTKHLVEDDMLYHYVC
jgi:hypothetical protein